MKFYRLFKKKYIIHLISIHFIIFLFNACRLQNKNLIFDSKIDSYAEEKPSIDLSPSHVRFSSSLGDIAQKDSGVIANTLKGGKGTVLVTGGSGYLGSHIVNILLKEGWKVRVTVRNDTGQKTDHLRSMKQESESLEILKADLLDKTNLEQAIKEVDVVINTAASFINEQLQGPIENPDDFIRESLEGIENLIECCKKKDSTVKKVIHVGSYLTLYQNNSTVPNLVVNEGLFNSVSIDRSSIYQYTKFKVSEKIMKLLQEHERIKLIIVDPGHILGPSLSTRTDFASFETLRNLLVGRFRMGIPKLYIPIVDVRDVAEIVKNMADLDKEVKYNRYLVVNSNEIYSLVDINNTIREHILEENKDFDFLLPNLPQREIPIIIASVGRGVQTFSNEIMRNHFSFARVTNAYTFARKRATYTRNGAIRLTFDTTRLEQEFKPKWTPHKKTIIDHVKQLVKDELIITVRRRRIWF